MTRVLVIDDEADVRLVCRINLEHAGFEVYEAASADMGLRIVREAHPDVVVLDVMLPLRDGISLLETLTTEQPSLPVLLLTVKSHKDDRIRGWEAGAVDYIVKPFSPNALTKAVARALVETTAQRERRRRAALESLSSEQSETN